MKKYTVYNEEGTILRRGQCVDKVFHLQAIYSNEFVMEGFGDDITEKIQFDVVTGKHKNVRIIKKGKKND